MSKLAGSIFPLFGSSFLLLHCLGAFFDLLDELLGSRGLLEHGDVWIVGGVDTELFGDSLQKLEHLGVFLFGEEVDLQVEMTAPFVDPALPVLGDHDEGGEEDRLERHDEREEIEGIRVDRFGLQDRVEENPSGEPNDVHPDEGHGPAKAGDPIRDAIRRCLLRLGGFFQLGDGSDVFRRQIADCLGMVVILVAGAGIRRHG